MKEVILAFDLGGTYLKYGLGTPEGEIIHHSRLKSGGLGSIESVTAPFIEAAREMEAVTDENDMRIIAAGVGTPGAVEKPTGKVFGSSPNVPSLIGVSLKELLQKELGMPVVVDNDANLATLGEAVNGAGKGYRSVLGLTLGTGIGGGFVVDGELYRGEHGSALEVGHTVIDYDGRICNCGKTGCIEAYASGAALIKQANELGREQFGEDAKSFDKANQLFEASRGGYIPALTAIDEGIKALSSGIANLINTLDPGCVVIGGGVMFGYKDHWKELENQISEKVVDSLTDKTPILAAKLGNMAGMVGAVLAAVKGG